MLYDIIIVPSLSCIVVLFCQCILARNCECIPECQNYANEVDYKTSTVRWRYEPKSSNNLCLVSPPIFALPTFVLQPVLV